MGVFGRRLMLVCSILFILFAVAWNGLARAYFLAFYNSAYAALLALPVAITLVLHCTGCSAGVLDRAFPHEPSWLFFSEAYLFVTWILFLLHFLVLAFLSSLKPTLNADTVLAACVYAVGFLLVSASHGITSRQQELQSAFHNPFGHHGHEKVSDETAVVRPRRRWPRRLLAAVLIFVLLLYMFLQLCAVSESVCQVRDWNTYRPWRHLVVVQEGEHLPTALYLRCTGTGPPTLLMEQGLLGMALLARGLLPVSLARAGWRVCVHDRRGLGWSDPVETDRLRLVRQPQTSASSVRLLKAVVEAANVSRPLVLAGHSYGGWHIARYALTWPEDVAGLVFLDASRFDQTSAGSSTSELGKIFRIVANFLPTGLGRLVDFASIFRSRVDLSDVGEAQMLEATASVFGGSYMSRGALEAKYVFTGKSIAGEAAELARKFPVLVLDKNNDWFPRPASGLNAAYTFVHLSGADHDDFVLSKRWTDRISEEIQKFAKKAGIT